MQTKNTNPEPQASSALDVLILCGGAGTRLQSVVSDRPKPMARFNGRCFLDILIDHFARFGLRRFILCTGHMSNLIRDHYTHAASNLDIVISNEYTRLGTAGSIKNAEQYITSDTFLVTNGDSFCPADIVGFYYFHIQKKASMSMVVTEAREAIDYGSVIIGPNAKFAGFAEKAPQTGPGHINAGIYLFDKQILSMIPPARAFSLEYDLFPTLTNKNAFAFKCTEQLLDIGTPERFELARQYFSTYQPTNA